MTIKKVSANDLKQILAQEKITLLDVRSLEKYEQYHITGQHIENIHIPKTEIFNLQENNVEKVLTHLPKDQSIVVVCTTGNSATKCASILSAYVDDVSVLDGGVTEWKKNNEE